MLSIKRLLILISLFAVVTTGLTLYYFFRHQSNVELNAFTQTQCPSPFKSLKTFRTEEISLKSKNPFSVKATFDPKHDDDRFSFYGIIEVKRFPDKFEISCKTQSTSKKIIYPNYEITAAKQGVRFWIPESCIANRSIDISFNSPSNESFRWKNLKLTSMQLEATEESAVSHLSGYTPQVAYFPEEKVDLRIATPIDTTEDVQVDLIQLIPRKVVSQFKVSKNKTDQKYSPLSYQNGVSWSNSLTFPAPKLPGAYTLKLSQRNTKKSFYVPLLVRGQKTSPILVLGSTNTWQAYNNWGGASFYRFDQTKCMGVANSPLVSFDRPFANANPKSSNSHLYGSELHLLRWLHKNNYPFDIASDLNLHNEPELLSHYKVLVLNTHSEYWSKKMFDHLERFLENGGHVLSISGNTLYRRVSFSGPQMELREFERLHIHDNKKGGKWRVLDRSESKVLGVKYDARGYQTFAPYEVTEPTHWAFDNTRVAKGDEFGKSNNRKWASGHETDKTDSDSPPDITILARGKNPENGGGEITIYQHRGGGWVFAVGSITFGGSLEEDPVSDQLVKNVLGKMLN